MKALALHPFFAAMVAAGEKRVEYRSWNTNYRGYLLICATLKKEEPCFPRGMLLPWQLYHGQGKRKMVIGHGI